MTARTWLVCRACATAFHDTEKELPHEMLTESDSAADLFRMGHYGHGVEELVVDA